MPQEQPMFFRIDQDSFNKLLTLFLMTFFMVMYVISYIQQKPIDWQALAAFAIPVLNHIAQIVTSSNIAQKRLETATNIEVAKVQNPVSTNGASTVGGH